MIKQFFVIYVTIDWAFNVSKREIVKPNMNNTISKKYAMQIDLRDLVVLCF